MIKPFKLLNGYTYSDEYIRTQPPPGIAYRHWNILPEDLKDGPIEDMEVYIQGWEAGRNDNYNNPYDDLIRAEIWNRGWHACFDRRNRTGQNFNNVNPNPPIDETYPEFYNTDELIFFDVSEERYSVVDGSPYKVMLFRSIEEGNTVEGQTIYPTDYMYNFPDVI